jgi:hypothetical protein
MITSDVIHDGLLLVGQGAALVGILLGARLRRARELGRPPLGDAT